MDWMRGFILDNGPGALDGVAALLAGDAEKRRLIAFYTPDDAALPLARDVGCALGGAALPHRKTRRHGLDAWPCS